MLLGWQGVGWGGGDTEDSGKGFVGTKFELFLAKLFGLLTFFAFKNGHIKNFHRDSWKPTQNYFLCTTPVLLPSVNCSDLISLGKQGLHGTVCYSSMEHKAVAKESGNLELLCSF